MGEVIMLDEHRARRGGQAAAANVAAHETATRRAVTFYFDPSAPESYLAAERVDRLFGTVTWIPVASLGMPLPGQEAARRRGVAARAAVLRLPLVWPDTSPGSVRVTRVATLAAEARTLPAFALAAGRLAYCGGFDLDDPEILAEAAAAAGLGIDACLHAAADPSRDVAPRSVAEQLVARGADRLPCFGVGDTLTAGEERLPEVLAAARESGAARLRPQAG